MIPPGLLPESSEPRRSPSSWIAAAVVLTALLAVAGAFFQVKRVERERDEAKAGAAQLAELLRMKVQAPPPAVAPPNPAPPPPPPPVVPSPPAEPRILPSRTLDPQHLAQGLHEFRAGRYDQAERQFFRAFPDSLLYLALTSLAQANYREAIGFLSRAMVTDPQWLRKVKPGDLFGSPQAYEAVVKALEEELAKNPINADLKTLTAYLQYHDKGAPYAKALLIEALNASPEHEGAKAFLEALGP